MPPRSAVFDVFSRLPMALAVSGTGRRECRRATGSGERAARGGVGDMGPAVPAREAPAQSKWTWAGNGLTVASASSRNQSAGIRSPVPETLKLLEDGRIQETASAALGI